MASLRMVSKLRAGVVGCTKPFPYALKTTRSPVKLLHTIHPRQPQWRCPPQVVFCSTVAPSSDVVLQYKHGRPVLAVPLPSRQESCLFFLRPMLMTVGDLIHDLQREDPGVTSASVLTKEASSVSSEHVVDVEDMKHMVQLLHTALHLPDHHLLKERQLLERLDGLKQDLSPLEQVKAQLARSAEFHSSRTLWTGVALLSVQGGALAWLTWWVYSWDVMEPVTYFLTYCTSIGVFSYYVLTKQDYVYPDAKDRQFLYYFHKGAKKERFNVQKYNELREELASVEEDLRRLRNPTQLQLPVEQIQSQP
ncbi:calcium uniporter protein, mitochondrial-like isoform X2 [Oncorhynchus nerka]|uniref:calcium uniporter protein, mitochondrial-like isoform X2 n=1 Tax=Oncorhynchus nerka TaxID=8023 RepID=UPI0031B86F62